MYKSRVAASGLRGKWTLITVVISVSIWLAACSPSVEPNDTNRPGTAADPPASAVNEICGTAAGALSTAEQEQSVSNIVDEVNYIREVNIARQQADSLSYVVWSLADAWDGAAAAGGDPVANANVVTMLRKVVQECDN